MGVSQEIVVQVNDDPAVTITADDTEICEGGIINIMSTVTGGAGANNYQWQELIECVWVDMFAANGSTLIVNLSGAGSYTYRLVVTQDAGCETTSDQVTITVNNDPIVNASVDDAEICDGGTTTLHVSVSGGAGNTSYQWQELIAGNWVDVFGADAADFTTDMLAEGTYEYRAVVTQDAG